MEGKVDESNSSWYARYGMYDTAQLSFQPVEKRNEKRDDILFCWKRIELSMNIPEEKIGDVVVAT